MMPIRLPRDAYDEILGLIHEAWEYGQSGPVRLAAITWDLHRHQEALERWNRMLRIVVPPPGGWAAPKRPGYGVITGVTE